MPSATAYDALLPLAIAIPLVGAALLAAIGRFLPRVAVDAVAAVSAAAAVADLSVLWARTGGAPKASFTGGWAVHRGFSVGIVLVADRAGTGMALLAATLVLAVIAYSWRYFDEPPREHRGAFPALVLLFDAGMCGFALTGDLFDAFVFFELMGTAAVALTGFRVEDPRPVQGALIFGVINSLAAYGALLGIGLLYARTGELGLAQIGRHLAQGGGRVPVIAAFVLVTTAFLVKAAIAPFHFWLADAHAVAPTPVCMLLSGIMVELGDYGVARLYWTVFSGPGGIPRSVFTAIMVSAGLLTAFVGALMCWQQRHLKRLLAFSTVAHSGLFLVGLGLLTPAGSAGTLVYVAGHAGAKAALFGVTGVLLDRHGSVDELGLYGRGRELPWAGAVFALGGVALSGLPPFATALGKALSEDAGGGALTVAYVLVSAITGGAVLRATLRIFVGAGPRPSAVPASEAEITGEHEEPEVQSARRSVPLPMAVVSLALLAASLLLGLIPSAAQGFARAAAQLTSPTAYSAAVYALSSPTPPTPPHDWTTPGLLLGLLSTALSLALALTAVHTRTRAPFLTPLRRAHSGHLGDYVIWYTLGVAALLLAAAA